MPLLQFLESLGKSAVQLPIQTAENISNTAANWGNQLAGNKTLDSLLGRHPIEEAGRNVPIQQNMGGTPALNGALQFSGATGTNAQTGADIAQVGLAAATPAIGKAAESAIPVAGAGGKILAGTATGAGVGGAFNTASTLGQKDTNPKDLTLNFLEGAGTGAALGAGGSVVSKFFDDAKLTKMAKNENTSQIEKDVKPVVGPVVAQKIAPAIAQATDKNVVSNVIDNALEEHNPQIPSPAPAAGAAGADVTAPSVSGDVNTGQGSGLTPEAYGRTFGVSGEQANADIQDIENREKLAPSKSLPSPESLGRNAQNNPVLGKVSVPDVQKGDINQPHLNGDMVLNHERSVGQQALDSYHQLSTRDQELIKAIETNPVNKVAQQADNPQAFKTAESSIRNYYDLRHAYDAQFGIKTGYRQNYLRQILESKPIDDAVYKATGGNLTPGYTMERLNAQGTSDVGAALERDIRGSSYNHAKLAYRQGLAQAFPGEIQDAKEGLVNGPNGTLKQLQTPYGQELFADPNLANQINKRAVPVPVTNKALSGYDTTNSAIKNFKLAGGGFHSFNVLGSYGGQQIISMLRGDVSPFRAIKDLSTVVKSTLSNKYFNDKMSELQGKGRDLDFAASGLGTSIKQAEADVGVKGKLGEIPVLKQIHEGIFGRQIPMLKQLIADQKFDALKLDRNNPEDLAKMKDISQELNQNFGGFNRYVQGISPQNFQRAARVFLSTDYNEGQIRSLVDSISKGGQEGKLAREVVFGKALLFGGIATGMGYAGGEFQGKSPEQVALDIIQKTAVPSASIGGYNVGLPTTQVAEVAKPIEQTISGAKAGYGNLQGIKNFATNRLAALPALGAEVGGNQNYLGQHLYGQNTHGQPIPATTTATNIASNILPIPAAQAAQTATGNQSTAAAIANTVGFRVTPQNSAANLPIEQQTYIGTLQKALQSSGAPAKTQGQVIDTITNFDSVIKQNSQARAKVDVQINKDIAAGNISKANADASAFNKKLFTAISKAVTPQTAAYLNIPIPGENMKTPYEYLTGNTYGYFTNLDLSARRTTINNNPTKYGLKIGQAVGVVQ